MSQSSKVAVIGSNSFSGSSFCDYALEQGADVIAMSRSAEPDDVFLPYKWKQRPGNLQFHALDLNNDLDGIMDVLNKERPGLIVNFAAQSMVGQSWDHPEDWFMTNAVSTVKLQNALRQIDYIDRYVHVTTPEVYGSTDEFITEDTQFNPSTPYAVSRAAGDMSLKTFVDAYDFPAVSTRAANVYGPGQQLYRIIPRTILYILTGQKLQLHGGGVSKRSFIHIRDVSEATWDIMANGNNGDTYHISTNDIVTIRGLVEQICETMNVDFETCVDVAEDRLGKDQAYILGSEKIRNELGWSDKISLVDGLGETIDWVKNNLDTLKAQPQSYIHKK